MTTLLNRSEILPGPVDTGFQSVYGATAAASRAGITYRQVDHWERMGVLKPAVHEARGSGDRRRYSTEDVRILAVLGELSRLGAKISNLAVAESAVRQALHSNNRWLVVSPSDFVETCTDETMTLCLEVNDVKGAWVIDIEAVVASVDV